MKYGYIITFLSLLIFSGFVKAQVRVIDCKTMGLNEEECTEKALEYQAQQNLQMSISARVTRTGVSFEALGCRGGDSVSCKKSASSAESLFSLFKHITPVCDNLKKIRIEKKLGDVEMVCQNIHHSYPSSSNTTSVVTHNNNDDKVRKTESVVYDKLLNDLKSDL